jgi:hypothetical protein
MNASHFKGLSRTPSEGDATGAARESTINPAFPKHRKFLPPRAGISETAILQALVLSQPLRTRLIDAWIRFELGNAVLMCAGEVIA